MVVWGLVRQRWLLIILGPALVFLLGSVLALLFLPHPIPKTATRAQRLYLSHCAECHGANGHGSWRATLFLIRPGDLGDPRTLARMVLAEDGVISMRFEPGALVVETARPDAFYARVTQLAASGEAGPIDEVTSPDDNLQAVFQYLVKQ